MGARMIVVAKHCVFSTESSAYLREKSAFLRLFNLIVDSNDHLILSVSRKTNLMQPLGQGLSV